MVAKVFLVVAMRLMRYSVWVLKGVVSFFLVNVCRGVLVL